MQHTSRHFLKDKLYPEDGFALCLDPAQQGFKLMSPIEN